MTEAELILELEDRLAILDTEYLRWATIAMYLRLLPAYGMVLFLRQTLLEIFAW